MRGKESLSLGPEIRDTGGRIEEINGKTVGKVVVLHVPEHVVVDIAEKLDLGLNTPIVAVLLERGMLVEHATIPATHLVVGQFVAVLDSLLLKDIRRLFEELHINPLGDIPMFLWYLL